MAGSIGSGCEVVAGLDEDVRLGPAGAGGASTGTTVPSGGGAPTSSSGSSAGGVGDGGDGAGAGGGGEGGALDCANVGYPLPPSAEDEGGLIEVILAVRSIALDGSGDTPLPGLNLDKTCTCPGPSSCVASEDADPDLLCDRDDGIDSQSSRIFGQIALLTNDSFSASELSQDADAGKWSLLMRLQNWTGEPDDRRVRFTLYPSPGFGSAAPPPSWDGTDAWPIDSASVEASGQVEDPLYVDEAAYVVGGRLVASLPSSGIVFAQGGSVLSLRLSGAFLVATIVEDNGLYGLRDGVIAAVWPADSVFESLDGFRDGSGDPLCTNDPLFPIARNQVCEAVDIFNGLATPTSPCNAISVGIGFSADQAMLGEVADSLQPSAGCDEQFLPSTCKCGDDC